MVNVNLHKVASILSDSYNERDSVSHTIPEMNSIKQLPTFFEKFKPFLSD